MELRWIGVNEEPKILRKSGEELDEIKINYYYMTHEKI
jgi:hypothetical protein